MSIRRRHNYCIDAYVHCTLPTDDADEDEKVDTDSGGIWMESILCKEQKLNSCESMNGVSWAKSIARNKANLFKSNLLSEKPTYHVSFMEQTDAQTHALTGCSKEKK